MSKRNADSSQLTHDDGQAHVSKRRKLRSCLACRKQKARCEFTTSTELCHRCSVLGIACTFEADAHANRFASSSQLRETRPLATSGLIEAETSMNNLARTAQLEARLATVETALQQVLARMGLQSLESLADMSLSLTRNSLLPPTPPHSDNHPSVSIDLNAAGSNNGSNIIHSARYQTPLDLGYIDATQSVELASLFEMRYNHCVYSPILKSQRITLERPFSLTVMCSLALRLSSSIPNQGEVKRKIHALLESHLKTAMTARPYDVDTIHAFLMLSLWGSVLVDSDDQRNRAAIVPDGWILLSTAISMANSLQLNLAFNEVHAHIRDGRGPGSPAYEEALEKSRVWYTLVTYDLVMSLGSVHPRLTTTENSDSTRTLINAFASSDADMCLAFYLDALLLTHSTLKLPTPTHVTQIASYATSLDELLDKIEALGKVMRPTHERPRAYVEYRIFRLYQLYCQSICLLHACKSIISPPFDPLPPRDEADGISSSEGEETDASTIIPMAVLWAIRLCNIAEGALNEIFPTTGNDAAFLSTAPDHLFNVIAFCAGLLIQTQVTALRYCSVGMHQTEERNELIQRTCLSLERLVLPDSDLPQRYALKLSTMLERWHLHTRDWSMRKAQRKDIQAAAHTENPIVTHLFVASGTDMDESVPAFSMDADMLPTLTDSERFLDPAAWFQYS